MARTRPIQTNFTVGELAPRLAGQVNLEKYKNAAQYIENAYVFKQGGVTRRSGTRFVKEVKDSTDKTRICRFEFNISQAYIIEFGNLYVRFYKDGGNIVSGGSSVEVATPYLESQLFQLQFAQSADVLYIAHQSHEPAKLTRTSDTAWTLTNVDHLSGPFLNTNSTAITMTPSATAIGAAGTLTASSSFFVTAHVGALFQLSGGYVKCTGFTSATIMATTVVQTLSATTATLVWDEGAWSNYRGFPGAVSFHDQALWYAGSTEQPTHIWRSKIGLFDDFDLGSSLANESINVEITEDNEIQWLVSSGRVLCVGTATAEGYVWSGSESSAITPSAVAYEHQSNYGSKRIQPLLVHNAALFVQRAGRKVREGVFPQPEGKPRYAPDLSILSEHITLGGIDSWDYAQELESIIWAIRSDGQLLGMTYERPQEVVSWHRQVTVDSTSDSSFESVAVIPHPDGDRDQVWVIVKRTINGAQKRYIEYFDETLNMDCALSYAGSAATAISGLAHLEGEVVDVTGDSIPQPQKTVSSAAIVIETAATAVDIGLHYDTQITLLRPEALLASGTIQGRKKSWGEVIIRVDESLGATINGTLRDFRKASDLLDNPVSTFTGDVIAKSLGWDRDGQIVIKQTQALPLTVLAVSGVLEVGDD